jgi:DNA-binding transcriptional MerR regulator
VSRSRSQTRSLTAARAKAPAKTVAPRLVRISDLAKLSGVPTATIKYYLREGLLPGPDQKTGRTMSYYDVRLADRVKAIKELQAQRFLPLKVISELLEPPPSGRIRADLDREQKKRMTDLMPAVAAGSAQARTRRVGGAAHARTRREVLAELQVSPADLELLGRLGLVVPDGKVDGDPVYGGVDLDLLELLDEVRRKGLGELFPMTILEPYAAAIRTLVRVEIELFRRQVLSGARLPSDNLEEIAREATALGERMIVALRAKLVVPELRLLTRPQPALEDPVAPPRAQEPAPRRRRK